MATTITKTIGTAGRDYSTLAAFAAAIPVNLVTADEQWVGVMYNDSEFTGTGVMFDTSGHVTDATRNIILTVAAGHSFQDHANIRTTAFKYDVTKGVGIRSTGGGLWILRPGGAYTQVLRVQIKADGTATKGIQGAVNEGTGRYYQDIFVQTVDTIGLDMYDNATAVNVVSYVTTSLTADNAIRVGGNSKAIACGAIRPSNLTPAGTAFGDNYGTNTLQSCYSLGYLSAASTTGWHATDSKYNGTNVAAGLPGTNNNHNIPYSRFSPLMDSSVSAMDLRPISSSLLIGNGFKNVTLAPSDITKTVRSATPTIGPFEYVASGTSVGVSATILSGSYSLSSPTISINLSGTVNNPVLQSTIRASGVGPWTTSSFTPPANSLLVVYGAFMVNFDLSGPDIDPGPNLLISASNGASFTQVDSITHIDEWSSIIRAWRTQIGPSPSSMTISLSENGSWTPYSALFDVISLVGHNSASPIVQSKTFDRTSAGDGPWSVGLNTPPSSSSMVLAGLYTEHDAGTSTSIPTSGWTEITDGSGSNGSNALQLQYRKNSTSSNISWDDTASAGPTFINLALAMEIRSGSGSTSASSIVPVNVLSGSNSIPSPTIGFTKTVIAGSLSGSYSISVPSLTADADINIGFLNSTYTLSEPVFGFGQIVSAGTLLGTYSIPNPQINIGVTKTVNVLSASYSLQTPSIGKGKNVSVGSISGSYSFGNVTIQTSTNKTVQVGILSGSSSLSNSLISTGLTKSINVLSGSYSFGTISINASENKIVNVGVLNGDYSFGNPTLNYDSTKVVYVLSGNTYIDTVIPIIVKPIGILSASTSFSNPTLNYNSIVSVELLSGSFGLEPVSINTAGNTTIQVDTLDILNSFELPTINRISTINVELLSGTCSLSTPAISASTNISTLVGSLSSSYSIENVVLENSSNKNVQSGILSASFSNNTPDINFTSIVNVQSLSSYYDLQLISLNTNTNNTISVNVLSGSNSLLDISFSTGSTKSVDVLSGSFSIETLNTSTSTNVSTTVGSLSSSYSIENVVLENSSNVVISAPSFVASFSEIDTNINRDTNFVVDTLIGSYLNPFAQAGSSRTVNVDYLFGSININGTDLSLGHTVLAGLLISHYESEIDNIDVWDGPPYRVRILRRTIGY